MQGIAGNTSMFHGIFFKFFSKIHKRNFDYTAIYTKNMLENFSAKKAEKFSGSAAVPH
jgi:predicted transcriptional regulator